MLKNCLMMSHYGLPSDYDDSWVSGSLELSIETLTGTAFEIRVCPTDTIMSIKSKIQRVEGIPIAQQHLLYNLEELDNSASVSDYSIHNGATLKLVLSMRGGPISTRRLPPVDEMAWRELQELMNDAGKDDMFDKLPSGSKVTVLVFRDGDQVNFFRVLENDDGTYSPMSESWSGSTIRDLFSENNASDSVKRLEENSVTMGKMQELKEKLESLSLQKKGKGKKLSCRNNSEEISVVASSSKQEPSHTKTLRIENNKSLTETSAINTTNDLTLAPCLNNTRPGLSKARKDAQNLIRMQSKLSILVDQEASPLKKTPLPDICRTKNNFEFENENESKSMRDKTGTRLPPTSRIAIVEEDETSGPNICSSQSSMLAMPSNEEVAVALSPVPRASTVRRGRYRVSRYLLDNDDRPKSTPRKRNARSQTARQLCDFLTESEQQARERARHILSTFTNIDLLKDLPGKSCNELEDDSLFNNVNKSCHDNDNRPFPNSCPSLPDTTLQAAPVIKKKIRCLQCNKKLNITNTHTCRCGNIYCSLHRYSEVHNCVFDYKQQGRRILEQANPLVAASKLPKI